MVIMIAKLRTKTAILWGGFNPLILNVITVEMREISKSENEVIVQITDNANNEITSTTGGETVNPMNGQPILNPSAIVTTTYLQFYQETRKPTLIKIPCAEYNQLFAGADAYMLATEPNLTLLEREIKRPKVALWLYFTNDLFENGKCGYNTTANQWKICE